MTAAASVWAVSASTTASMRAGMSRFEQHPSVHKPLATLPCKNPLTPSFRCSDCPVLDDIDEEITDEEMELLVNMDFDDFENNKLEE